MGIIQGYINDIVYSEVILGFLRAQTQLSSKRIREKLPSINMDYEDLRDLFSIFINLPSHSGNDIFQIMNIYHLMPHDALIAASCKQYGLNKIVTNDSDFSRVNFLEIINQPIKEQ
ncbi:ribonuclease VapC [Methanospirillum stamsii]|uniref:Ribonuclease VapC n=2 Tax=Methanospirillum stamsii TaxID=1277351 RepID=A0A2V2MVF9_9EURY|nr:ribonuclease VapC [Methanospirillum stamsii]